MLLAREAQESVDEGQISIEDEKRGARRPGPWPHVEHLKSQKPGGIIRCAAYLLVERANKVVDLNRSTMSYVTVDERLWSNQDCCTGTKSARNQTRRDDLTPEGHPMTPKFMSASFETESDLPHSTTP